MLQNEPTCEQVRQMKDKVQTEIVLPECLERFTEVFGPLPKMGEFQEKVIELDVQLKQGFDKMPLKCKPHPCNDQDGEEIERQIAELKEKNLVEEVSGNETPLYCSPCFFG